MENFKVLYKRFVDDARTITEDSIFAATMKKEFNIKFRININNLYNNSPAYFQEIHTKELFPIYQLWFLTILIIDYVSNESVTDFKSGPDLIKWVRSRKDPNIPYFIRGPLRNQYVKIDFISHYKNLMDPQNSIADINQYLQLSSLQQLNIGLSDTNSNLLNRPNAFDKLPDSAKSFVINIDSKDTVVSISNGMTVFDCNKIDLEDVSEINAIPRYDNLMNISVRNMATSKIANKKLEMLFNTYSRLSVISMYLERNAFKIDVSYLTEAFIVFPGIYANERNVYSDKSNDSLRIAGYFQFDSARNVNVFVPRSEYITFRGLETVVKNFAIYLYFPGIGDINMAASVIIYSDSVYNVPITIAGNASRTATKYILSNDNVVYADNNYFKMLRTDTKNNQVNTSNDYKYHNGRLVFDYYTELIKKLITINNNMLIVYGQYPNTIYPVIDLFTELTVYVNEQFQFVVEGLVYDNIEAVFNIDSIYINDQLIKKVDYILEYVTQYTLTRVSDTEILITNIDNEYDTVHIYKLADKYFMITYLYNTYYMQNGKVTGKWLNMKNWEPDSSQIETYKIDSLNRPDELPILFRYANVNDLYSTAEATFNTQNTYECAGIMYNNEFIKCDHYRLFGKNIYTATTGNYSISYRTIEMTPSDAILIYPVISIYSVPVAIGNVYFEFAGDGYVISPSPTYIISIAKISKDNSLFSVIDQSTGLINIMALEGDYYQQYVLTNSGIYTDTMFSVTALGFDCIDISECHVYKLIYDSLAIRYVSWPMPIPSNFVDMCFEELKSEPSEYNTITPIVELTGVPDTIIPSTQISVNYKYGKYPLIKTNEPLFVNKNYKLTVDNKEYIGMILKNNEYYSFTKQFTMNQQSKITMEVNSSLFTLSLKFD